MVVKQRARTTAATRIETCVRGYLARRRFALMAADKKREAEYDLTRVIDGGVTTLDNLVEVSRRALFSFCTSGQWNIFYSRQPA